MALGDIYRVAVEGLQENQQIVNVFWYLTSVVGAPPDSVQDVADAWQADAQLAFLNIHTTGYALQTLKVRKMSPTIPPPGLPWAILDAHDRPVGVAGSVPGTNLPLSVALVMKLQTDTFTRRGRGRIFFGGVPTSYGNLSAVATPYPAALTTYRDFLDNIIQTTGLTSTYDPVVISRLDQVARSITLAIINPYLRSQRRREIGVGS